MSDLFVSSHQMQVALKYAAWTYDQFSKYIKGDCLEVGCGVGTYTDMIARNKNCKTLIAIDISKAAIDFLKQRNLDSKIKTECIDLMDVEGKFDFIVCMNVMEHIKEDDVFFEKLLSLLKMNGILFLLVPAHHSLYCKFDIAGGHYRRYSKKDFWKIKNRKDLVVVQMYYFNLIGAIGYGMVYKFFRKEPMKNPKNELSLFDKIVVPFSRFFLPRSVPFGISLITVIKK